MYSLSCAVGAPLRLVLSPLGKALPCRSLQGTCNNPFQPKLSCQPPTEAPVPLTQPQLPPFTDSLIFTELSLCKEQLKMPCTVLEMQRAHYLQLSHEPGMTLPGKPGIRCQKLPGHWELVWLNQGAGFVCETIFSMCQTVGINSAHRKTD